MLSNLRVEYLAEPVGMDEEAPRFSWETSHARQRSFRIRVHAADGSLAWDSGEVPSAATAQIAYAGKPLEPFTRYRWQVTTRGDDGETLEADSCFETGFLKTAWTAPWIQPSRNELRPEILPMKTCFNAGAVSSARLCVTALGIFKVTLNGKPVADDALPPGWTQYDKRLQYRVYDVGELLVNGENTLWLELAPGWFSGRISRMWYDYVATWGKLPFIRAELRLTAPDGTVAVIPVDAENTKHFVGYDSADIYDGTHVAAWHRKGMDMPLRWQRVAEVPEGELPVSPERVWSCSEPVAHIMDLPPVSIVRRPNGAFIVDFGQNVVGRERFTVRENAPNSVITIRHGEFLNGDGSLYCENLRSALATTTYISGDGKSETFEPELTFFGFRYLEVTGWPGELRPDDIQACVLHTRLTQTGGFTSSEPLLNRLNENILWGQRGNFVDIPTDCPQRDERLGWTGDTQVFADEATWNMDAAAFYTKWLADLNAGQGIDGSYTNFSPNPYDFVKGYEIVGASGWSDAGVIVPWVMLEKYADIRLVTRCMPHMLRWLDSEIAASGGTYILKQARYGDWLFIGFRVEKDSPNETPEEYISSAYLAGMLELTARMLRLIGDEAEAARRERQYREAKAAFGRRFLDSDGNPLVRSQTALLMALKWKLFDGASATAAANLLVHDIRELNGTHLTTGFLGTPMLLDVLASIGEVDLAYDLLLQTTYPGWLYPVTQGATTMWERWNSYTLDGGFGNAGMNSFNHYAYGAVGAWFYRGICGINPLSDSPEDLGFARFRLKPLFGKRLRSAAAEYRSIRGTIRSAWKREADGSITWSYTIPPNTCAEIILPGEEPVVQGPGEYSRTIA